MATLKATILQNFATIGIPDFEEEELVRKNWSIVGLSENLIDEDRLVGLQQLNTRRLDLVIHNGSKFALLNLQAFKIFECQVATDTVKQCVAHYLTPDGNLLFGIQPSGDVIVLTDGLQKVKQIRKPAFIKFLQKQPKWYEDILDKIAGFFGASKNKTNQVSPEAILKSVKINEGTSSAPYVTWWQPSVASALCLSGLTENLKCQFPYLTSLLDGLALLCAFSPTDCYVFLSSYETALRVKSIANIKGGQVPGRWYRIIMHKSFIAAWLEDKKVTPLFEARLCYKKGELGDSVGGAMLYGVMEELRLELVFGIIKRRWDKFTLSWEMLQFEVDWARRESDRAPYSLGARFVAKLSSDCTKIVVVISNHLGMYIHVQEIPFYSEEPIRLKRQKISLCTHSDHDGCHFYNEDCWISDVQWLVEDAYFAVMTLCGSLSIFYNTGEPMIVKVRKPGPEYNEDKSARFYFPVFYPHQIVTSKQYEGKRERDQENIDGSEDNTKDKAHNIYPTIKWIDSEQVLTCSSGMKIELFSIQRVIPVKLDKEQSEIWLGESKSDVIYLEDIESHRKKSSAGQEEVEEYGTTSYSSFVSSHQSNMHKPEVPDIELVIRPARVGYPHVNNNSKDNLGQNSPVLEYRYSREDKDGFDDKNGYYPEDELEDDDVYPINNVESPSRIEELPSDGGEVVEDYLENFHVADTPTPEKLRMSEPHNFDPEIIILSVPESLAEVGIYDEEYSDGSSEPDIGNEYELNTIEDALEKASSLPYLDINNTTTLRKRSQQYMADDEADDAEETISASNYRKATRRRSAGKSASPFTFKEKTPTRPTDASNPQEKKSHHHPQSSSNYETELSGGTYSSPFSCAPTSAEDIEEVALDEDDNQVIIPTTVNRPESHSALDEAALLAAVSSKSITANLQIPPVPKISGVIVPSERQSDMLLQDIELPQTTLQPELMRYKPPPTITATTVDPYNIIHFKSKTAGERGIRTRGEEKSSLPLEGVNTDFYMYDGEEEDFDENEENVTEINGSVRVNFSTKDRSYRYRNSSV